MDAIRTLFFFGRPFAPLYATIMRARAWLYKKGFIRSHRLPVPVVSVGNLTMGGTGKTPTVQLLANFFLQNGFRPAVVSRGYGGTAKNDVNIVSNGKDIMLSPEESGDEPYMLAVSVPGLTVLTGAKRINPCRYACCELGCDIILLDDGFQHLAVQRDLDIVLFNATTLAGNCRVFPAGELRESFSALARADLLLLTGLSQDNKANADKFMGHLHQHCKHAPIYSTENTVGGLFTADGKPAEKHISQNVFHAFCGIAHPERFECSLRQFGIQIAGISLLRDHAVYSREILNTLSDQARANGATALVTTEKDWVKLKTFPQTLPLYYLAIRPEPVPEFFPFISRRLQPIVHRAD